VPVVVQKMLTIRPITFYISCLLFRRLSEISYIFFEIFFCMVDSSMILCLRSRELNKNVQKQTWAIIRSVLQSLSI